MTDFSITPHTVRAFTEFGPETSTLFVGKGATFSHFVMAKFEKDKSSAPHLTIKVEAGATYNMTLVLLHDLDAKITLDVHLEGEGASCNLGAVYLGKDKQKLQLSMTVFHKASSTRSQQLVRGIMADSARMTFAGAIDISPKVKAIDGSQLHEAILLSDEAEITASPVLAICSEDVKCTHGSSIGMLSEDQLFYLESRGIPKDKAKALLLEGFVLKVIDPIVADATAKQNFIDEIKKWLEKI